MKNKRIASLLIVLVLMLSTFSSAFAAPYDLKNNLTEATYDILTWSEDAAVLLDVAEAPHKYAIQVGEDFYAADEIIAKMQADPTMTIEDAIVGLTPVDQEPGEGDLEVVEVSAINATTVEVEFSEAIDPTKAVNANFRLVDKVGDTTTPSKTVVNGDKTKVTLTVANLDAAKVPYQIRVMEGFNESLAGDYEIVIPTTYPAIEKVEVTANNTIKVTFDKALVDTTATAAFTTYSAKDLADDTKTADGLALGSSISGKVITLVLDTAILADGGNYELTIPAKAIKDAFGNENAEAVKYTFSTEVNEEAPDTTAVQFVASEVAGEIDAIVTFDQDVAKGGSTPKVTIQDRTGFVTVDDSGGALTIEDSTDDVTARLGADAELETNQILIQDVGSLISMTDAKEYHIILAKGTVKQATGLVPLENEETTPVAAYGVDVVAPRIDDAKSQLNSATEIKVAFDEAVTYDASKTVTVTGFKADGSADDIEAVVQMIDGGKAALLTPKTAGQLFQTEVTVKVKYPAETFVDLAGNKIADGSAGVALTNATDKAAPAVLAIADGGDSNTLTIKFTENISQVGAAGEEAKITVNGEVFEYAAAAGDTKWAITTDTITVTKTGGLAVGDSVSVPAGAVEDTAENLVDAVFGLTE